MPHVGMRELVAALHQRRERRREAASELANALGRLRASVDQHLERIAGLKAAVAAQGGDMAHLKVYDNAMAALRAQLRSAEQSLADAFREAAGSR